MTAPKDDLVERLLKVESGVQCSPGHPDFGGVTNWYRNPDGPEAAREILRLREEVGRWQDKAEGLECDLRSAVEVAFNRGATEWARLNYPDWIEWLEASARPRQQGETHD